MPKDRIQRQRFETKYLISKTTAVQVRDFVQGHLPSDEFSVGKPDFSYSVYTLYLDSDSHALYQQTINKEKNRYKLRLRSYSDQPDSPVFFEIKRYMNQCILKQGAGVRPSAVAPLLAGCHPEMEHLVEPDSRGLIAIQNFCTLMTKSQAKPKFQVNQKREAYMDHQGDLRVTMDRDIYSEPNLDSQIKHRMNRPIPSFPGSVILELKFTNRFPDFFREVKKMVGVT